MTTTIIKRLKELRRKYLPTEEEKIAKKKEQKRMKEDRKREKEREEKL